MPIVNVYSSNRLLKSVHEFESKLRDYVAQLLSVPEISMDRNHISLRFIEVTGVMIGDIEFEIIAHCFESRVKHHDDICGKLRRYMEDILPDTPQVRVWLILAETGYSYELRSYLPDS